MQVERAKTRVFDIIIFNLSQVEGKKEEKNWFRSIFPSDATIKSLLKPSSSKDWMESTTNLILLEKTGGEEIPERHTGQQRALTFFDLSIVFRHSPQNIWPHGVLRAKLSIYHTANEGLPYTKGAAINREQM